MAKIHGEDVLQAMAKNQEVKTMVTSAKECLLKELQIGLGRPRPVRAPRGAELHCKSWHQEAALRMPAVAGVL